MSKFQKYYADPEYRARHLAHMSEKIECPGCGAIITRSSYGAHKEKSKHKNNLRENDEELTALESERHEIERIYNKKIRAMKRKRNADLEKMHERLQLLLI